MFNEPCREQTEQSFEQIALFLLGLLEPAEQDIFGKHLRNCEICSAVVPEVQTLLAAVAISSPPQTPDPNLRGRVLASIAGSSTNPQVWKNWELENAAIQVVRRNEGEWSTVHPGIHVKQLSADPGRDSVTMLIRMDPGARYLPHRHGGPEHCFVLEGELREGDLTIQAGDYQYAAEDSVHSIQWTETGCLLLITCSQSDELLV